MFRRIWLASLASNLGILVQGVGAAWAMTQMTSSADKVALVQTALMLPIMLIAMPAGAIADMHDRRIVAMVSLSIALTGATALTVLAWLDLVTPNMLLALCFVVGSGMALFGPAWQASVSEQVPRKRCHPRSRSTASATTSREALGRRSAASWSPPPVRGRVCGQCVALSAVVVVLFMWSRVSEPSRLPRERLNRAIVSGVATSPTRPRSASC